MTIEAPDSTARPDAGFDSPAVSVLGTIVSVQRGHATVQVEAAACPRCAAGRGCGALAGGRDRRLDIPLPSGLELSPGERVRLAMSGGRLLAAAWLAYGLPLAAMLATVIGVSLLPAAGEGWAVLAAGAGIVTGGAWGRRCLRRARDARTFVPFFEPDTRPPG